MVMHCSRSEAEGEVVESGGRAVDGGSGDDGFTRRKCRGEGVDR